MTAAPGERWRGRPSASGPDRSAQRPLAAGDVLDVPGFEFLLQPVYWLVLAVHDAALTLVAIDRGEVRSDLHLPRVVEAGDGMSGWTVRCRLVRVVATAALPQATRRIGALHAQLGERLSNWGLWMATLPHGSQPNDAARDGLPSCHALGAVAGNASRRSAYERSVAAAASRLLPEASAVSSRRRADRRGRAELSRCPS
ncbi:MAG: hypothetical protein U1F60_08765 [Planctomycetota bacterium]